MKSFFFNDTATTEIYTLSLHDALPISNLFASFAGSGASGSASGTVSCATSCNGDRKSTRLNSSHGYISYAVFCLKKKKKQETVEMECSRKHKYIMDGSVLV